MTEDDSKRRGEVETAITPGVAPQRPMPPERFEREPEPSPKTALDRLIRLIAV